MTDLDAKITQLRADIAQLTTIQDDVARRSREIAAELRAAGLTNIQIAARMGISRQRVGQLLPTPPATPN